MEVGILKDFVGSLGRGICRGPGSEQIMIFYYKLAFVLTGMTDTISVFRVGCTATFLILKCTVAVKGISGKIIHTMVMS